jgi:hypothetical protein
MCFQSVDELYRVPSMRLTILSFASQRLPTELSSCVLITFEFKTSHLLHFPSVRGHGYNSIICEGQNTTWTTHHAIDWTHNCLTRIITAQ